MFNSFDLLSTYCSAVLGSQDAAQSRALITHRFSRHAMRAKPAGLACAELSSWLAALWLCSVYCPGGWEQFFDNPTLRSTYFCLIVQRCEAIAWRPTGRTYTVILRSRDRPRHYVRYIKVGLNAPGELWLKHHTPIPRPQAGLRPGDDRQSLLGCTRRGQVS